MHKMFVNYKLRNLMIYYIIGVQIRFERDETMAKEVKLRLRVLLAEREWDQKDLVAKSNLTTRAVSDMYNDKQKSYPKSSLNELVNAFGITDMNELFKLVEIEENE